MITSIVSCFSDFYFRGSKIVDFDYLSTLPPKERRLMSGSCKLNIDDLDIAFYTDRTFLHLLTIENPQDIIGYREFNGPRTISYLKKDSLVDFYGFECDEGRILGGVVKNSYRTWGFYIQEKYRKKYSNLSRLLAIVSIELMKDILLKLGKCDQEVLCVDRNSLTGLFTNHYNGKRIKGSNDVIIPFNAKYNYSGDIKKKERT